MINILKKDQYLPMNMANLIHSLKQSGFQCTIKVELHKMVEVSMGRIEKKITIVEVKGDTTTYQVFWDSMKKMIGMGDNLKELKDYYSSKGYKTEKKFYMEDLNMTEETWNEWNGIGNEEE